MSTWHYADSQQQQRGPVDATWLQAAYARGEVGPSTLVWREGMAGWKPLAEVAGELGIAAAAPPRLPARGAPVALPPKSGGLSGCAIAAIAVGAGAIPVLGILLAIAIPAYQDYTVRAKVLEGYNAAAPARLAVAEHWIAQERCPGNDDEGLQAPERYAQGALRSVTAGEGNDGRCTLTLEYHGLRPEQRDTLVLAYQDERWVRAGGTLEPRYLPVSLR